ncbi:Glycosyltransferase involved in cell wall bisynthesis [Mucilaginibacter gossypiicola]|uniref:Glycosyltransferase involved in cell wall bisynthesis n=1 Tax=Mucilaginibacter gossypiicola TaxID=551995 RepID=A0A1H8N0U0_9SPHI|nr:glycosyltransferase family 2 protein [Mucilaginibacter gossypiicola]SEO23255.1 Glycosyltransferase involved in cell wall bisynthesis [Mucilaginibacter gossypiicola]
MSESLDIIILTFNEAKNIGDCLQSAALLKANIYIVDSGSTDNTLDICRLYTQNIFNHPFENYAAQRNWALDNLPLTGTWILNLDADHRVTPELAAQLNDIFSKSVDPEINGFLISRRTMFMGKWIKHGGHYPTYHANLFRQGFGHCEEKLYDQHFKVTGNTQVLKTDIIDVITDSLTSFIARHNHWATLEAQYLVEQQNAPLVDDNGKLVHPRLFGNPMERRRYMKKRYEAFPLFVRPVIYFTIRYFIKLGFLDGKTGLVFHFLQGFWFRFLIDAKIYELRKENKK